MLDPLEGSLPRERLHGGTYDIESVTVQIKDIHAREPSNYGRPEGDFFPRGTEGSDLNGESETEKERNARPREMHRYTGGGEGRHGGRVEGVNNARFTKGRDGRINRRRGTDAAAFVGATISRRCSCGHAPDTFACLVSMEMSPY